MLDIDTSTEFGARVQKHLREDLIVWLVTVDRRGAPQPSPVWFLWEGETALIYSQPDTGKLRNIAANPRVALNFDGNGQGGDIVILTGSAAIVEDALPSHEIPEYVAKYGAAIQRNGWTPASFAADYSVPIRVTPEKLRGH
jgi:PPOX class probable F420-dependent enzyme